MNKPGINSESADGRIRILIIIAIVRLLGAAKPVIFNGGSSMAKYVANQNQLEMVQESQVESVFDAVVFGEGTSTEETIETVEAPERAILIERIFTVDRWIAWTLLLCPFLLLSHGVRNKTPVYHSLLLISLWLFLIALGSTLNGGKKFSELSILAHATRWGLPLFIWYLIYSKRRTGRILPLPRIGLWILIICSSLTFAVHGTEAFLLNPPFQDLIYSFGKIFGITVAPSVIHTMLKLIGTMDLLLAVLIIVKRSQFIYLGMAIWGFITALSRPVTMGIDAWPEFAMRIANSALPFILFYVYQTFERNRGENSPTPTDKELLYDED